MGPVLKPKFTAGPTTDSDGRQCPALIGSSDDSQPVTDKRDGSTRWPGSASQAHCPGGEGVEQTVVPYKEGVGNGDPGGSPW